MLAEFKEVEDNCFNTVHYCDKDNGSLRIFRWVDNNVVTIVSSVHNREKAIMQKRKRLRKTNKNKGHLEAVFRDKSVVEIEIPGFIDNYNHWMLGVDKANQLIAYYRPKLKVVRNWFAMFLHCLDVSRNKAHAACALRERKRGRKKLYAQHQKIRVMEWIDGLVARSMEEETLAGKQARIPRGRMTGKKDCTSTKKPKPPKDRFAEAKEGHIHAMSVPEVQRRCRYCACYLAEQKRQEVEGDELIKVT